MKISFVQLVTKYRSMTAVTSNSNSTDFIAQLIEKFNLVPHPEGGYYAETYRSDQTVRSIQDGVEKVRSASTAIHFLITPGNCSRLHRLTSDEGE